MPDSTLLRLTGAGIPPYSARGITETLAPISAAAQLVRTVNGELDDLSDTEFRKYAVTWTCRDTDAPAFGNLWPGQVLEADLISELAFETSTGGAERTVVSSRDSGEFTFYRPRLTVRVLAFSHTRDEWGAATGWTLEAEEV